MDDFELGNTHYYNKEFQLAKECYERFIESNPNSYIAYHNLGIVLIQLGQNEEALKCFEIPCKYNYAESFVSRGTALRNIGRYHEALLSFAQTFVIDPDHCVAYSNYGNTLREFGKPDLAIDFLRIARKYQPDNPNFELNECVCHLMKGDLPKGWELYESRWYFQSDVTMKPNLPGVEFDGTQNIKGKKIVVYYEQGFGDCIQFARYIPELRKLEPEEIIVVMRKQLLDLYKFNFPYVTIVDAESNIPPYHYHVALLALPKCFNTTIDTIPYVDSYLTIDDNTVLDWYKKLGLKNKPRIGLLWSPNKAAYITRFREIELEKLLSIVSDKYEFISLSYEMDDETLKLLEQYNVKSYHNDLYGFYNTAGLIKNLDLVITIDTVIPHLSGALGVPTWVMLSDYGCDWRWFLNRSDSPFYNCMTLFRQQNGNWDNVLNDIKNRLG